jgi:hypothetical protein
MSSFNRRGWLDSLSSACFTFLLAAIATYVAVGLIKAVWPVLLLIVGVAGLIAAGMALLRHRDRGW